MDELPVFPWNDVISMSDDVAVRVFVIVMASIHEAINANTAALQAGSALLEETQ